VSTRYSIGFFRVGKSKVSHQPTPDKLHLTIWWAIRCWWMGQCVSLFTKSKPTN